MSSLTQGAGSSLPDAVPKSELSREVWEVLSQWMPSQGPDHDYWWRLTGPHLAMTLKEAGYSPEKQYEILLIYYHWAVPYMGPKPRADGNLNWRSLLTVNGAPVEYSWKWKSSTSKPDVRLTMEPINRFSGTGLDPLNHSPSQELLHCFSTVMPDVDLAWSNHFFASYFDHDKGKYMEEANKGIPLVTSIMVCLEFLRNSLVTKTYFCPRKLGQRDIPPAPEWERAIHDLDPNNAALDALDSFLATSPEGKYLKPCLLAVDNVASSRLKLYFGTPRTSFASTREIMTLGGRITGIEKQLLDLQDLIKAITPIPVDHPDDAEITAVVRPCDEAKEAFNASAPALLGAFIYYFDVAPGAQLPDIKCYISVRNFGMDDLSIAKGVTDWMKAQGRGSFCPNYMRVMEGVAGGVSLDKSYGLQTFVSCTFKKEELDITSYFSPKFEHEL